MLMWRPVGMAEVRLIYESGLTAFPPRLPEQPILYIVLNREYAARISREWNAREKPFAGYVTEFEVEDEYASRWGRHLVGDRACEEIWVPAEQAPEFNRHVVPPIRVVAAHFGEGFQGFIPDDLLFAGRTVDEQLLLLSRLLDEGTMDSR